MPIHIAIAEDNSFALSALQKRLEKYSELEIKLIARNGEELLEKLKEKGVECYFEKEGIFTFDGKEELLLTIMSSLAQEESRSISENVTWGQRKRFSDGNVSMPYKQFLRAEIRVEQPTGAGISRPLMIKSPTNTALPQKNGSYEKTLTWHHTGLAVPCHLGS